MNQANLTRRKALKAGAGLFPLLAASSGFAAQAAKAENALTIGMATTDFRQFTNERLAEELAKTGMRTVQLFLTQSDSNYWKYNQPSNISTLTP
jgi:hypothetical protein